MNEAKEMTRLVYRALEDKMAEDIKIIDISGISILADYFIIANGKNVKQVQALIDHVEEVLGKAGYEKRQIEGYGSGNWILMDYNDIIIHIFDKENRLFYDLERIWSDGRTLAVEEL